MRWALGKYRLRNEQIAEITHKDQLYLHGILTSGTIGTWDTGAGNCVYLNPATFASDYPEFDLVQLLKSKRYDINAK